MKTNVKDYAERFVQAVFAVLEEIMGKKRQEEIMDMFNLYVMARGYPKNITWEDISAFLGFLYDKFPDKKKQIDSFRMNVNRANETRAAGYFFTEDSYYTIKGIIENVKKYLSNFKGWEDDVCTYVQEAYDKDYFYYRFTTRVYDPDFEDYFDKCSIEFNKNAFFKDEKKILLDALTKKDYSGIRSSVKKELQEEVFKKLWDMLPEDFFAIDDLTIKGDGKDEAKKATVTPKGSVWSLIVQDIAKVLERNGSYLNHPACKNPDMIEDSIDNMRDFIGEVNNAIQCSFNTFWVSTCILKILMRAKNKYEKRAWHLFVNNGILTILDNNQACQLLYNGVKLIVDCLKDDLCCVKLEHYPLDGAVKFCVYPTTTEIDNNEDVKEFFWDGFLPRNFSNHVQYLFDNFRPLIKESKKEYFLKNWTDLFPNTEIN